MLSLEKFNSLVELEKNGKISLSDLNLLEPYKIKRAVFFAAGFGSRLVPLTLEKPKPLIEVNGVRMIDTLLDAVLDLGIDDITIVRGYKKDKMDVLLEKYPMIKFIDNDLYNEANNISSALMVKDLFENTLVLESDLILYNTDVLSKYAYESHYLGVKMAVSDDWCFKTKDLSIQSVHIGGEDVYQMVGISYWNQKDGLQLSEDIEKTYSKEDGKSKYWDEVMLVDFKENYEVKVKPIQFEDIIEIDTYDELKEIDQTYQ